jgi:hypothetical protein
MCGIAKHGDGFFEPRRPAFPLAKLGERETKILSYHDPQGRRVSESGCLRGFAKHGDGFYEPCRTALPFAQPQERKGEFVLRFCRLERRA